MSEPITASSSSLPQLAPRNLSRNFSLKRFCNSLLVADADDRRLIRGLTTLGDELADETVDEADEIDEFERGDLVFDFESLSLDLLPFRLRMHEDSSCLYRYDLSAKDFPHRVHVCGLVFEWVWICARRLDLSAKALAQMEHSKGFSPEKMRILLLNMLLQTLSQSGVLTRMCSNVSLKQPRSRKSFTAVRTFASLIMSSNVH